MLLCDLMQVSLSHSTPMQVSLLSHSHAATASQARLRLVCCAASLGMRPITDLFKHVILTSGTLAPMDALPKLLGFQPLVTRSICVDANPRLLPVVVTRGNDQVGVADR